MREASSWSWAARLAAAVFGLGVAGTAPAAVYVGTFDPQYGAPFTAPGARVDLGWRGEIRLDIANACLVASGDVAVGGGCTVGVDYAFAVIYDINDLSDNLTLNFSPTSVDVTTLRFSGGELTGLQTDFFSNFVSDGGFTGLADDPDTGTGNVYFALSFVLDDIAGFDANNAPILYSGPLLPWARPGANVCDLGEPCGGPDVITYPPTLVFTPIPPTTVPLPGTAALGLLALAAAAAASARGRARR